MASLIERSRKPWRLPLRKVNREPASWVYRVLVLRICRLLIPLIARRHWAGQHNIPATGGVIIVANHISNIDPVLVGEYLIYSGRWPRFLAKTEVWGWPVVGWVARRTGQIRVFRDSERARDSLAEARRAITDGQAVVIYPEGTITTDPENWPMTGRRGAARLALETGAAVVPVAQWGAHEILGGRVIQWRRLFGGRRDVFIEAGPPVDLGAFRARLPADGEPNAALLDDVTAHLLDEVAGMLAHLRGEPTPEGRWDMRLGGRVR